MRRGKKLLSFAASLLLLASLLLPLIPPVKAHADPGPPGQDIWTATPITTCQELQDIAIDTSATYTLGNDLDCSGFGFVTIGEDVNGVSTGIFEGRFYGQGHTISNLGTPLFGQSYASVISNLNVTGSLDFDTAYGASAFLVKNIVSALIIDVHITGTAVLDQAGQTVGGMFVHASNIAIIRSSAVINAQIQAGQSQYGGIGYDADTVQVRDSYAKTTMTISSGGVEHAGGLFVYGTGVSIANSYTSGSIDNPAQVHEIGGLIWYTIGTTQVTNSFSKFQGVGLCNGTSGCSGLVTIGEVSMDLSTAYFDQTAAGTSFCSGAGGNTTCNRVNTDGSQGNYFNNNSTNAPLSAWDFTSTWATTAGLPTLRSFTNPSPQPGSVEQLTANIGSASSVELSWTPPSSTGSAPVLAEEVYYQKVGETTWERFQPTTDINSYSSPAANFTGTSLAVTGLYPNTSYNFEVVLYNQDGYFATATVTGVTAIPGFHLINNCQQLQDMSNNLLDNYELGRNIDCSDSVNWNSGQGFVPIGCIADEGSYEVFSGALAGNNYTISNIHVDGGSLCNTKAIFGVTREALIQDVNITNPTIEGGAYNNYSNAALVVADGGSTFSNIHVYGDFIGDSRLIAGGLIGSVNASGTTVLNRVSFVGNVSGDISANGIFGGLIGSGFAPVSITDSYVQVNLIDINNLSYGLIIGGFVAYSHDNVQITRSYASLNYDASGTTFNTDYSTVQLGGFIGTTYYSAPTAVTQSFARTQVQGYSGDRTAFGGLVGLIYSGDSGLSATTVDLSGNYFDADSIGTNQCAGKLPAPLDVYTQPATCTAITGQPNYFNNNSTNPPLNSWDFDNIWQTTSTLPIFGRKVLTTITPIPASRLTPKPVTTTAAKTTIPAQPVPPVTEIIARQKAADQAVTTASQPAPQGIIAQLKRLVGRVPTAVLVSFPYILFVLLLLTALALLVEMLRQAHRLQTLNLLLAEQRSVADKRDTFWHLAANYLRAPITLLMGGADLLALSKVDTAETRQLTTLSQRMQTKVAGIMHQIEHSHTLQGIKPPQAEKPIKVWRSFGFWLPVVTVAVLIVLTNYVAQSWRNLQLSTINLATQALVFLLVALALYWVLGALGLVNRRRRNAERLLRQQEQALDAARLHLMRQIATDLDTDVSHLQSLLAKLSAGSQAKPIMQEGASRLRHLVDSFQLLISAQNHRLGGLSPAGAHTSLDRVLKASLAELEPMMSSKDITLDLPAKQRLRVPGNANLNGQVLSSVLANAIAFSPSGSTIRLGVKQTESGTYLRVADHGPGITATQQAHLFEPFTKADGLTGLQLDHGGLGINLYLDRQIMDHLGGGIAVHSVAGRGTVVELHWPHAGAVTHHPGTVVHPSASTV